MSLNSFNFVISFIPLFFIIVILQLIRNRTGKTVIARIQVLVLLAYSYWFICYTDVRFGVCIALLTLIAYSVGMLVENHREDRIAKISIRGGYL